jgi:uncharacterized phage protein (TIGR02218 family)
MKSHVADYQYRIYAIRMVARNGITVRFVAYPHDLQMGEDSNGPVIYQSDAGYEFSGLSATSSMSPSVIDLEGVLAFAGITRDQIASGVWDNASIYLFATTWTDPQEDEEPLGKFILGKTTIRDDRFVAEMMHLIDALNQEVGRTVGPTCPWQFGSIECGVDLNDHTYTGTITAVTDRGNFTDSSRAEAAEFFDGGTIEFTSGDNVGLRALEIQKFEAGGVFQLFLPFHYLPQVGNTYTVIRGCPKTRAACKSYDNILNFGGFPDQPTTNMVNKAGGQ